MRSVLFAALLVALPASAGTVVTGAAGGVDFGTNQPWVGLDVALHPDRSPKLFTPTGRITPVFTLGDRRPAGIVEVGLLARVPDDNRTVRAGLVLRGWVLQTPYRLPLGVEVGCNGREELGLIPAALARVEFEFGEDRPFEFGLEGGVGAAASSYLCAGRTDQSNCIAWFPGMVGGFYGRGAVTERLYLEALLGPTIRVGVGARL